MERSVIFRDKQELQSSDLNNIESFTRSSIDHVVVDAIEPQKKYSGFSASKTSSTQITVAPGRLYAGGVVYARDENTVLDAFNILPIVTKKRVAIVAWGQTIPTDVQPRDFLVDAQTGQTEPQAVAMEDRRYCEINLVAGVEAADPQYPATDANVLVLAYAVLDTSGVVSIEPVASNVLSNLSLVNNRTGALEDWRGVVGSRLNSLSTDLAALAKQIPAYALNTDVAGLSSRITAIEAELAKPRPPVAEFAGFWEEFFADESGSDPEFTGYSADVDLGLRFGNEATATSTLTLLNPNEPSINNYSGFLLPKFANVQRLVTKGYDGEVDISTESSYSTTTRVQKTKTVRNVKISRMPITRKRTDPFWDNITVDAAERTFSFAGQTFAFASDLDYIHWLYPLGGSDGLVRNGGLTYYPAWVGTVDEPYWENVTTSTPTSGNIVAQTFLWSQTAWLSQIGLFFSRAGPVGGATILVTETTNDRPDLSKVIGEVTLDKANIVGGSTGGSTSLPPVSETLVSMTPMLLCAGRRYAIVVVTSGTHYLATSKTDQNILNGTLFKSTDIGGAFASDTTTDLKLNLYTAQFNKNLASIEFTSFQLAGGMSSLGIKAQTISPAPTSISYEIYDSGVWVPVSSKGIEAVLAKSMPVVRLRAIFSGTIDLMPGLSITPSEVVLARSSTSLSWVSNIKYPSTSAEKFTVSARIEGLDGANNSLTAKILSGVSYATETDADVTETIAQADGMSIRTWTFTGITPGLTAYRVKLSGSADTLDDTVGVVRLSTAEFNVT